MDNIIWCILGLVLIVSAHAGRFDQGPQTFQNPSIAAPELSQHYETKDVLLYLTPSQVKALEAGGAFVRPQNNEDEPAFQTEEEEQDEEEEEDDDRSIEQEQNIPEQPQLPDQNSELEEIFKILNKQIEEITGETQKLFLPQGESQYEEESEGEEDEKNEQNQSEEEGEYGVKEIENPSRQIPERFGVSQRQNGENYFAPSVLTKLKQQAKNSYVRPQTNNQKSARYQQDSNKKTEKRRENNKQEQQEYVQTRQKFIPVEENPLEESKQESDVAQENQNGLRRPTLSTENVVQAISQHRGKLIKNELQLQTFLQEFKEAPTYNNQKYAIEIEKLKENLQTQNALARAELLAKSATFLNKEESDISKKLRVPNNLAAYKVRAPKSSASQETVRPIPVPVIKRSRIEVKDPVPVEIEKDVPAAAPKQLYVNINEPYYVERIVPVDFKKGSPIRKPGELTIIRHVWEH